MRVRKSYFWNSFREHWPTLSRVPHWLPHNNESCFFVPLLEFQRKSPPINISCLKSWSHPFKKEEWKNYECIFGLCTIALMKGFCLQLYLPCQTESYSVPKMTFLVNFSLVLSHLLLPRTKLTKCIPSILMKNCDDTICPSLSVVFFMPQLQLIKYEFLKSLFLS